MVNVWIAPGQPKNIDLSILKKINTPAGKQYAWAMNAKHIHKFAQLEIGDIVVFGHNTTGYKWVAEVTDKPTDIAGIDWPYKSPSGAPWSNVFYIDKPTEITVPLTPADLRNMLNVRSYGQTQQMLKAGPAAIVCEYLKKDLKT